MKKNFRKPLALMVSAALCLTAFVGCLTVNAEGEPTGTVSATTEDTNIKVGDQFDVKVAVASSTENIEAAAALLEIGFDATALDLVAINNDGESEVETGVGTGTETIYSLETDKEIEDITDSFKALLLLDSFETAPVNEMSITLTFEALAETETTVSIINAQAATAGEFDITTNEYTGNEDLFVLTTDDLDLAIGAVSTEPVYNPSVTIFAKNALFKSDYSLMYAIPVSTPTGWYIVVKQAQYDGNTRIEDREIVLTADDKYGEFQNVNGQQCYVVLVTGISARQVASEITATLYQEVDGVMSYGDPLNYNLVTYANVQINRANPTAKQLKLKNAMIAFLNYATATQTRFSYNTDNLANASLDASLKSVVLENEPANIRNDNYAVIDNPIASIKAFAPSYKDKITLCVLCDMPSDRTGYSLKFEYTSVDGTPYTYYESFENAVESRYSDGKLYPQINFSKAAFKDVRATVLITVVDSNLNAVSNTTSYSFESYAASRSSTSADRDPARALINFGDLIGDYSVS